MLKKIAYICRWDLESGSGVSRKIRTHIDIWRSMGMDVKIFCRSPRASAANSEAGIYPLQRPFSSFQAYSEIIDDLIRFNPDLIYYRYEIPDRFSCNVIKKFAGRVAVEINSNDVNEFKVLCNQDFLHFYPRRLWNSATRHILLNGCACIVSPTYELSEAPEFTCFSKPFIVSPNSINLADYTTLKKKTERNAAIGLLFLGSPSQSWHGLDSVLQLAEQLGPEFHIHIVGPERQGESVSNVTWHGFLDRPDYQEIAASCAAGIGSLGLYKYKMNEASTLKVREYIAMGLPILLGYLDTAFIKHSPEWVYRLPNHKDAISSESVLAIKNFLARMCDRVVSHDESRSFIDANILEQEKIKQIFEVIGKVQQP